MVITASPNGFGVFGSGTYTGIKGEGTNGSGVSYGVYGMSSSEQGYGIYGSATASDGNTYRSLWQIQFHYRNRSLWYKYTTSGGFCSGVVGETFSSAGTVLQT